MRLFGHPVHAIVVALPLGLLSLVPVWELLAWFDALKAARLVAYYSEVAGLVGGALALATGLAELLMVSKSRPELLGRVLTHAAFGLGALTLFALALAFGSAPGEPPAVPSLVLECAGAALLALTGWFGGDLVFGHGVAVRRPPA